MRPWMMIFMVVGLGLAGCSHDCPPKDTLRVGIGAEPVSLDPHLMEDMAEYRVLSSIYEGLVTPFPSNGQVAGPGIAKDWSIANNGLFYTFHLRKEAKWSNGIPLIAADFIASWRRAMSPSMASPYANLFESIKGAKNYQEGKGKFEDVGIKSPDPYTLTIELIKEDPIFLQKLSHPVFYPVYMPKICERGAANKRGVNWVVPGNTVTDGPFILDEHIPYEKISVVKNPFYYKSNEVDLKKIEFYPIESRSSEEMAFLSGLLDITISLPIEKVAAYLDDPRLRMDPALQVEYILVNTRKPPFDRKEVRQAFSMALNRKALCKDVLRGGQAPAFRLVPPECGRDYSLDDGDDENTLLDDKPLQEPKGLREDPTQASKLPALAAVKERIVYSFNSSEARKSVAETLQSQWQQNLGITIGLQNLEWKTFLATKQSGNYILARAGWSADFDDPSSFLELFTSHNPNNTTGWSNASYDRLVDERKFLEAENILLDELPCIPLYFNANVYLISPRVKGWESNLLDFHDWRKISLR